MKRGIIYGYYQPITDKWYVGKTIQESGRKSAHKGGKGKSSKTHFGRAIKRYGFDSFEYHILFEFHTDDVDLMNKTLSDKEIYFIELKDSYKNGYNLTIGGEGSVGYKHTDESKSKMLGRKNALGHKHSDETRKKLSEIKKGNTFWLGIKQSFETIKKRVEKCQKPIIQYDLQGNEIKRWISATEAAKMFNKNKAGICTCIRGRQKTAHGFIWKYA